MCTYLEFFKTKLTTHFNISSSSVAVNSRNINFISVKKITFRRKKTFLNQFQLPISPLLRLKGMVHKSVRKQWLFKSFFQHHSIIAKKKKHQWERHRPYPLLELQCTSTIKSRIWVQFGLDYLLDYVNDSKNSEPVIFEIRFSGSKNKTRYCRSFLMSSNYKKSISSPMNFLIIVHYFQKRQQLL